MLKNYSKTRGTDHELNNNLGCGAKVGMNSYSSSLGLLPIFLRFFEEFAEVCDGTGTAFGAPCQAGVAAM